MRSSRMIEIEDVTAGIVVQERPGLHRFYAADRPFRSLEARTFTNVDQAARAARALLAAARTRSRPVERATDLAATPAGYFI